MHIVPQAEGKIAAKNGRSGHASFKGFADHQLEKGAMVQLFLLADKDTLQFRFDEVHHDQSLAVAIPV